MMLFRKLTKAWQQFALQPVRYRSFNLFVFQLAILLHERTNGHLDSYLRNVIATFRSKRVIRSLQGADDGVMRNTVRHLEESGYAILPWRLNGDDVVEIRDFAFSTPAYVNHPRERISIREFDIPRGVARFYWRISDLIRVPAIQRIIGNPAFYEIAQEYLGCFPLLTSITLWLDPVNEGTYDAHVYHYDNDGPKFLKFFFYLNDLDTENGAHTFIKGTHGHIKPSRFSSARRYSSDDLLAFYGPDSEMIFSGPSGTILAEDTAGFHKGIAPRIGYRMLMQMQFAAMDIPHLEELAMPIKRVHIANIEPNVGMSARKFVS